MNLNLLSKAIITERYDTGEIESVKVEEKNEIKVSNNIYIPYYSYDDPRRKDMPAIRFYKSGKVRSLSLQEPTYVSVGIERILTEKIVFFEDGNIKRIFPLDGAISGYWTEDDEYELASKFKYKNDYVSIEGKIISIQFYKDKAIRSISFWPKERFKVNIQNKMINCRIGIGFYENGQIRSVEPSSPVKISTPIGDIEAFDRNALGIHGENTSLNILENGNIKSLITSTNIIEVKDETEKISIYSPKEEYLFAGSDMFSLLTVNICFDGDYVFINKCKYNINKCSFNIKKFNSGALRLIKDNI